VSDRPTQRTDPELSDAALEELRRQRFQERVQRVLAVMTRERIDWRGIACITPDGRIAVRVVPIEMSPEEQ